jgi:GNAT superfamily N-acetyltransferase
MTPEVQLRACVAGDGALLSLVGQASFLEAFAGVLPGADILQHCQVQHAASKYEQWLADGVSRVWLAEALPGMAPVAYLVLTTPDLPLTDITAQDLEVKRVYALHRYQGCGLGRRLMETAAAEARSRGALRLLVGVYGGNADAIAFYRRLGYVQVGTRTFQVGANRYNDLILALDLAAATA